MTDAAPKPTSTSPAPGSSPAEEPQGALGAVLVGGAILLIAALLIFWPGGDTSGVDGKGGARGQQANNGVDGDGRGGPGRGITPREADPAEARVAPRVREGLLAPTNSMAMVPTREPEPTSFPSVAAEIVYLEKKLVEARANLESRAMFLERMKKIQTAAPISEQERNARRAKVVQDNYDKAQLRVDDLVYKLKLLRKPAG